MKNTQEITIDGKQYTIDLNKAINDGYLKPKLQEIKTIDVGDVFKHSTKSTVLLAQLTENTRKWYFSGFYGLHIHHVFDKGEGGFLEEALEFLNKYEYVYIKNINQDVKALLKV